MGGLAIVIVIIMSRQQLDKSKDQLVFSPILTFASAPPRSPLAPQPLLPARPPPNFFDKFKCPLLDHASAFSLYEPASPASAGSPSRKSEIIRKHRGNYRKYTVLQKQEAVKQVTHQNKQILQGMDAKEISEKYGIPRRNLLRWKKNGCERKEGGGRPTDGEMELTLYTKIENRLLTTEKEIRAEAKLLSKLADFKASKGWYCKFSRRYNQWKRQKSESLPGQPLPPGELPHLLPEISEESSPEEDARASASKQSSE